MTDKPKFNHSEIYNRLKDKKDLTYDDIHDLVEYLIITNANSFSFDGFTEEDIAQEIRLKCFLLLPKWDKSKCGGNPIWFFKQAIKNHLLNLRRDQSHKNPNYTPENKGNVPPMMPVDMNSIRDICPAYQQSDFELINNEILKRLTRRQAEYYYQMIENMSLRGIPMTIKNKIVFVIKNVISEKNLDLDEQYAISHLYISYHQLYYNINDPLYEITPSGLDS